VRYTLDTHLGERPAESESWGGRSSGVFVRGAFRRLGVGRRAMLVPANPADRVRQSGTHGVRVRVVGRGTTTQTRTVSSELPYGYGAICGRAPARERAYVVEQPFARPVPQRQDRPTSVLSRAVGAFLTAEERLPADRLTWRASSVWWGGYSDVLTCRRAGHEEGRQAMMKHRV
jgi:hypothetical protein